MTGYSGDEEGGDVAIYGLRGDRRSLEGAYSTP